MYQCATNNCTNEADFDSHLCTGCLHKPGNVLLFPNVALENAAIKSAENFGTPEFYFCFTCGYRFNPEEFARHVPCEEE